MKRFFYTLEGVSVIKVVHWNLQICVSIADSGIVGVQIMQPSVHFWLLHLLQLTFLKLPAHNFQKENICHVKSRQEQNSHYVLQFKTSSFCTNSSYEPFDLPLQISDRHEISIKASSTICFRKTFFCFRRYLVRCLISFILFYLRLSSVQSERRGCREAEFWTKYARIYNVNSKFARHTHHWTLSP